MKLMNVALLLMISAFFACSKKEIKNPEQPSNLVAQDRMLLVLSAVSVHDNYYAKAFDEIVEFQIGYAQSILSHDNVVVVVDEDTRPYFENKLPADVLLTAELADIWMRDFTTVAPGHPVQFKYTNASMSEQDALLVQNSFTAFANGLGISRDNNSYSLDGGNVVDNYAGRAVVTNRFCEDNNLSVEAAKTELKQILGLTEIAIIEPDEPTLAHADGMVAWVDENTLLVNDYSDDPEFRNMVIDELTAAFPTLKLIEIPFAVDENTNSDWAGFSSACGINLNAVLTHKYIYVPTFGMNHESVALQLIKNNTSKTVIPVDARNVCAMGGSVRCLTWQVSGSNAEVLIKAAQEIKN